MPSVWAGSCQPLSGLPCRQSQTLGLGAVSADVVRQLVRTRAGNHPAAAGGWAGYVRAGAGGGALDADPRLRPLDLAVPGPPPGAHGAGRTASTPAAPAEVALIVPIRPTRKTI